MKSKNFPMLQRSKWALLILAPLLASCANGTATRTVLRVCNPWHPINPSAHDVLTDSTAKQILSHDCIGVRLGCWPPPSPQACVAPPSPTKTE